MKVVYSVASNFGGSGIGTTAYQAVRGIFRRSYLGKVCVASFRETEIPRESIFNTDSSFFEGLRFLPSSFQWFFKDNFHDLRVASKRFSGDLFHGWSGHSLFSMRAFKKKGAITVIERASSHPLTFVKIMNQEYQKRGLKFSAMLDLNLKKLLAEFEKADFIMTPSEFSYRSMIENGVGEKKLIRLPFGVDLSRFRSVQRKGRSLFRVLFAGQIGLRKGVLYLLEAWQKLNLKEAELVIAGQADREILPFLSKFRNLSSVRFLGYSDVLPLYQSADVFVFPSLEEGSALVTYEALACGLPLITTFESGSVIEDGVEGYLVPSRDADALAGKIKFLYDNGRLRSLMSQRASLKSRDLSWEAYGENLVECYDRLRW